MVLPPDKMDRFQWAVSQLEVVMGCVSTAMVEENLRRMPRSLKDTYDGILLKLPREQLNLVRRALIWLCFSARPVTLLELAEAVSIDDAHQSFDAEKDRIWDPSLVTRLCPSLITTTVLPWSAEKWVIEKNMIERKQNRGGSETIVTLAHYTVKEYLVAERMQSGSAVQFYVSNGLGHAFVAEACLVYILSANGGRIMKQLDERDFAGHPLLAYAAAFWIGHLQQIDDKDVAKRARALAVQLLSCGDLHAFVNWLNVYNPDTVRQLEPSLPVGSTTKRNPEDFPRPVYYCALVGDLEIMEHHMQSICNINAREGKLGSPLTVASYHGNNVIVKALLAYGADPNINGGILGYPLQAAALNGSIETVRTLLEAGAEVNARGGEYHTALIAAASREHQAVVSLLLKSGADLEIGGQKHGKALRVAAAAGNINQVLLLLAAGANVNDDNEEEGTALYAASEAGSQPVVQLLLRKGAEANRRSGPCAFALQAAAKQGHAHIIRILLKAGADVNATGGRYGDALQAAVESFDMESFRLLLDSDADVTHEGGMYGSALRAAVRTKNLLAADKLLERGSPFDDDEFLAATEMGNPALVQSMLEAGADVNSHDGKEGSALIKAIAAESEDLVWLILSHDPDVHARGEHGDALCWAAGRVMHRVVEELCNRGADVNSRSVPGRCALEMACRNDNRSLIELLLAKGADVNRRCSQYGTP